MINKKEKGKLGEDIACKFLKKNGFIVVDRNYYKKWGELDIVAKKGGDLHFFEVKSVTRNILPILFDESFSLSGSSSIKNAEDKIKNKFSHDPEENVHGFKVKQLRKIIQTYLTDKGDGLDSVFQFHVLCVYMNEKTRRARVQWIKNVIL